MAKQASLTPGEVAVLAGLASGLPMVEVARRLNISRRAAHNRLASAARVIGWTERSITAAAIVTRATQLGAFDPSLRLDRNGMIVRSIQAAARRGLAK